MVVPGRSLPRVLHRSAVVAALVLVGLLGAPGAAQAHASLVGGDPKDGQVLAVAPERATFTFNEPVRSVPDGVRLFDDRGAETDVVARTRDARLIVDLPGGLARGTHVIAWRVVSEDGHPIAGTLTFSVGARSVAEVATNLLPSEQESPTEVSVLQTGAQVATYVGIFGAAGLTLFLVLVLPRTFGLDPLRNRLLVLARGSGLLTLLGAVVLPPVSVLYQRALGLDGVGASGFWSDVVGSPETVAAFVAALATAFAVYFGRTGHLRRGDRTVSLGAVALALGSLSLVGHTRSENPLWLVVAADLSHVTAGALWFGGLLGLVVGLRGLAARPEVGAVLLGRFSQLAALSLAAVAVTGSFLAQRILGSWAALFHSAFGQALLVKVAIVALVALIAAWNRFRLMPAVLAADGSRVRAAAATVIRRTVLLEAALLVVVLGLTGFLVDRSPVPQEQPVRPLTSTYEGRVGGVDVVAELDPVAVGRNTVVLTVRNSAGDRFDPAEAPAVSASQDDLAIAERTSLRVARGTYRLVLTLPRAGTWTLQVSVRVSEFDNPVVPVDVRVPPVS